MRVLCVVLAGCVLGCVAEPEAAPSPPRDEPASEASLSGRLLTTDERLSPDELARTVVYLEPTTGAAIDPAPAPFEVHHRGSRFEPELVAVAPDDAVWFVNDDAIFHGAFSYSRPDPFDLGVYGPGERRLMRFVHAGPVRIHCPIHSEEEGVVFVVATRLVVRPAPSGAYQITGASAGRYWLKAWADGLPTAAYDVTLRPGEAAFRDIVLGSRPAASAASRAAPAETGSRALPRPAPARPPGSPGSRRSPIS